MKLVFLRHSVDNNSFELKKAKIESQKNTIYSNIFFNYYKEPNIQTYQDYDKSMIFSIGYEYLIGIHIMDNPIAKYSFTLKSSKDHMTSMKLWLLDPKSLTETKIRKDLYNTKISNDTFDLNIQKEALTKGMVLKIYCKFESFYFKKLIALPNFVSKNFEIVSCVNIPDIFKYSIPSDINLELIESSEKYMRLKDFIPYRIVDYNINSKSVSWKVIGIENPEKLIFDLISIDLPADTDFGTSVEHIMRFSAE